MNLFDVADYYINKIVTSRSKLSVAKVNEHQRIKVLLLDNNTTPTISLCATQSDLLKQEIYLVDKIENEEREVSRHLRCLVYVKPTEGTLQCLLRELRNPRYGEYQIFFNNIVSKSQLERLAESDDMEAVTKVEEIFQDFFILNQDLFSLDLQPKDFLSNTLVWSEPGLTECSNSLVSVLLSLKIKPEIRFEGASKLCERLAKEVSYEIGKNERTFFDFPVMDSTPILLILDRKTDPITPLLQPWTYQSMINEYIGVKRNIVDLSKVPKIDKDLEKVTLSSKQDAFFRDTMYLNFGELGDKVKQYVTTYKDKTQTNSQINTIEDIKNFIEKYPEFRKLSGNVAKHMAIVGELDRQLKIRNIWEVSEIEQNLSSHDANEEDFSELIKLLQSETVDKYYKLKLACIYSLNNHANSDKIRQLVELLTQDFSPEDVNFFHRFKSLFNRHDKKAQSNHDKDDILSELARRFNSKMSSKSNTAENVYMQHIPEISSLLTELSKNTLSRDRFKTVDIQNHGMTQTQFRNDIPQDVILFFVGGVTYEEARLVHEFNETMNSRMRVVLGGTSIVSTNQYMDSLRAMK
ncbi:Vps45p [Saccharomyces eubayanus]|uniref:Vps45p n=1 Tax=Saccharomyces eubayanus TaxID=1080349 RepID=UPI0006C2D8C3|nr:VPS45-like protein [Saccharomyces eubayanus]KOG99425.1 VPS45-like protein [Saccharomyces eubayanus]